MRTRKTKPNDAYDDDDDDDDDNDDNDAGGGAFADVNDSVMMTLVLGK